ncbi:Heterokaryon incompatibility protein 6, OR allele [Lachnellula arida]|uniref:Heterokaryon incompatibility protein 6, OR allele n=1 Tax=Lachnellula arida TaxID=1316785 RepID=A0A8T9B4W5_9HELO|nr:Heterokaryon incompatibility protein 6, OR allele [Lachnellula arida]
MESRSETAAEFIHSPLDEHTADSHPIRLLHLQPSEAYYSPITCTIEHVDLRSMPRPRFKALSYAWGDANIKLPIQIEGRPYYVAANCHAALLRLREVGETVIWIDAICINQLDDDEKSVQISMMADVYSSAAEVIVWLGRSEAERRPDDEEKEQLALGLVNQLHGLGDPSLADYQEAAKNDLDVKQRWAAFSWLCFHGWFDRLWTLQETCVTTNSKALLQYQAGAINFLKVQKAADTAYMFYKQSKFEWIAFKQQAGFNMGIGFDDQVTFLHERQKLWQFYHKGGLNLRVLLGRTLSYKCTEPKDRIFAVLAFLTTETVERIELAYCMSLCEIYSRVTRAIIQEDQSFRALCLAGIGRNAAVRNPLPTWIVDLRVDYSLDRSIPYPLIDSIYRSSGWAEPIFCSGGELSVLNLAGLCVDTIQGHMDMFLPNHRLVNIIKWTTKAECLAFWRQSFTKYPTACDPVDAWVHTISVDSCYKSGESRMRLTEEYFSMFKSLSLPESKKGASSNCKPTVEETTYYQATIHRTISSRAFFISTSGYMGVGPKAPEEGDMICVIPGCNVPLLIREEGDHHLLVGECFVWGLMDGEALQGKNVDSWRDKKFEEIPEEDGLEIFRLH